MQSWQLSHLGSAERSLPQPGAHRSPVSQPLPATLPIFHFLEPPAYVPLATTATRSAAPYLAQPSTGDYRIQLLPADNSSVEPSHPPPHLSAYPREHRVAPFSTPTTGQSRRLLTYECNSVIRQWMRYSSRSWLLVKRGCLCYPSVTRNPVAPSRSSRLLAQERLSGTKRGRRSLISRRRFSASTSKCCAQSSRAHVRLSPHKVYRPIAHHSHLRT